MAAGRCPRHRAPSLWDSCHGRPTAAPAYYFPALHRSAGGSSFRNAILIALNQSGGFAFRDGCWPSASQASTVLPGWQAASGTGCTSRGLAPAARPRVDPRGPASAYRERPHLGPGRRSGTRRERMGPPAVCPDGQPYAGHLDRPPERSRCCRRWGTRPARPPVAEPLIRAARTCRASPSCLVAGLGHRIASLPARGGLRRDRIP